MRQGASPEPLPTPAGLTNFVIARRDGTSPVPTDLGVPQTPFQLAALADADATALHLTAFRWLTATRSQATALPIDRRQDTRGGPARSRTGRMRAAGRSSPGARQRRRPCRPDRMRARPRTRTPTRAPRSGATATLSGGRHTQGPHPQVPARALGSPMLTGARPEPVLRRAGGLCHPVRFQNAEAA